MKLKAKLIEVGMDWQGDFKRHFATFDLGGEHTNITIDRQSFDDIRKLTLYADYQITIEQID